MYWYELFLDIGESELMHFTSSIVAWLTKRITWLNQKSCKGKGDQRLLNMQKRPQTNPLIFCRWSLLFCKANSQECGNVLKILEEYEEMLGQKINKEKTSLFFSKSTKDDMKEEIKNVLGVNEIRSYEKYLGLPSLVGRDKKASFNYIKERVWRKLQGWEGKLISQADREVLIKAVAQAIPTYAMRCFKLPFSLCHEIEAMVKKFFWGQWGDKRKIHWVKWSELTKSKLEGGMGFRDLTLFNDSHIAKQAWWLLRNEDTLFFKIFKARFFPHCSFMEAKESATGSYAWKSILKKREVIQMGARFRVGNGRSIKIWQHHWLPIKHPPLISSPIIESMEDATVDSLIDNNTENWDAEMLKGVLVPAEAELALRIPLPPSQTEDVLFWPFTANGHYNFKSRYKFLKGLEKTLMLALTRRWTENYGRRCGHWKFQISTKICCGVRVGTLFQPGKTWYGELLYKLPPMTVAPYKQRTLCKLCGVARVWMRCGMGTVGVFIQIFSSLISKSCAVGFLKWETYGTVCCSSMEHLEPA